MRFRVATPNLEQDHKRWEARNPLITAEIAALKADIIAFNEVSIPLQTAKSLQEAAAEMTGLRYNLVQQTRANGLSRVEAEDCSPGSRQSKLGISTSKPAISWRSSPGL
jgi:hypothetical protein